MTPRPRPAPALPALLVLALLASPAAAGAPDAPGLWLAPAVWRALGRPPPDLTPGPWVVYEARAGDRRETLRLAAVAEPGAGDARHLELRHEGPDGETVRIKLRFTGPLDRPGNLSAVQVQVPGLPALTFPARAGLPGAVAALESRTGPGPEIACGPARTAATAVGPLPLRACRVRPADGEAFTVRVDASGAVPLFGLVELVAPGRTLRLLDCGTGARAELPPMTGPAP